MVIPGYISSLLGRARYEYDTCTEHPDYAVGYTISIRKRTDYQSVKTLRDEVERLRGWVLRQPGGDMRILSLAKETHYCPQYATVTIFDPVMKHIEKLIQR